MLDVNPSFLNISFLQNFSNSNFKLNFHIKFYFFKNNIK